MNVNPADPKVVARVGGYEVGQDFLDYFYGAPRPCACCSLPFQAMGNLCPTCRRNGC